MASYTRATQRFGFAGIQLGPPDALGPGKYPYVQNLRAFEPNAFQVRPGLAAIGTCPADIHTISRLNDPGSYAAVPALRLLGAGTTLYVGPPPTGPYVSAVTGLSGNPLTIINANPSQSPRPWAYIADANKLVKINTDSTVYNVGMAQPLTPPTAALAQPGTTIFDELSATTGWSAAGSVAGAPSAVSRVNTTINSILYDSGSTGWASIAPVSMISIGGGCRLSLAGAEIVTVEQACLAVATTTIGAIIYDSGSSGPCTIQPAASLGTGVLASPPIQAYEARNPKGAYGLGTAVPRGQVGVPPQTSLTTPAGSPTIRQADFPVNCLVNLNGAEIVRITAVSVGTDGVQGFRCSTTLTHAAGESLVGLASFRAYLTTTRTGGDTVTENTVQNVLTPVGGPVAIVGGIQKSGLSINGALVGGRGTLPEDLLHLSIKIDQLTSVTAVRLYLNVDVTSSDFLRNYYVFEWRAADILAAIQGSNFAVVSTFITAAGNQVVNQQVANTVATTRTAPPGSTTGTAVARGTTPGGTLNTAAPVTGGPVAQSRLPPGTGPVGGPANPVSAQLALGNSQWIELTCKIGDLLRVGTDPSATLQTIGAIEILVHATTSAAITVDYNALYIRGGYGPDVGDVGDPYVWRYRYRSSATGVLSNVSPAVQGGLSPRRSRCLLVAAASADPQVDTIDWFRQGGGLPVYTYVGSGPNTTATFNDDASDSSVNGGETPPFDDFQPWPTLDLPRSGTCNVAGNAIQRTGGDLFNVNWAPGALVLVNGKAASIAQVVSSSVILLAENVGSGTGLAFHINSAEILGRPLPSLWGPFQVPGGGTTYFACGDPNNPGTLYWTKSNNPDVTSDAYSLIVTSGAEVLQCGWIWDGRAFVGSSEQVYEILPDYARQGQFTVVVTPCGRGPFTPWAYAVAPEGVYLVARDGIVLTAGGGQAQSVTNPDLTIVFPHDGLVAGAQPPYTGVLAPDYSVTTRLRLSYLSKFLYFDFRAIGGLDQSLIFDTTTPRWYADTYLTVGGVITRYQEPGSGIDDGICSTVGLHTLWAVGGLTDNFGSIAWALWTPWVDGGDLRQKKLFGDFIVDADPQGSTCTMQVLADDYTVLVSAPTFGAGIFGRQLFPFDINSGAGILAKNLALQISGVSVAAAILYAWEPSYVPKVEDSYARATDWEDLGYPGAKFIQGLVLRANTFNAARSILVQGDGVTQLTLSVLHNGEVEIAYPNAATGWTPFIAQLVRFLGNDSLPWQLYSVRWVFEPAPELATQWTAQPTSADLPGYLQVRDLVLAHQSTADLSLTLKYDGGAFPPIVVPNSGGVYQRSYISLPALKGKSVQPSVTSSAPFRVFKRDCSFRVQGWGQAGGYRVLPLFGGPSRPDGAAI